MAATYLSHRNTQEGPGPLDVSAGCHHKEGREWDLPYPRPPVLHVPSHRQAERSCRANPCEGLSPPLYGRSSPSLHNRLQTGCGPRGAFAGRERPVTRERHMRWAGCLADPVA